MNFVKRSSEGGGTRGGLGASGGIRALLLPASNLSAKPSALASSSCSVKLTERLM